MGLSNEERISQMIWACHHITEEAKGVKRHKPDMGIGEDIESLMSLIDQIWPAMIGMNSNGLHWILGSSATSQVKSGSLWGEAISHHCSEERSKYDIWSRHEATSKFDPLNSCLSIEGLLRASRFNGELFEFTYKVYAYTESLTYALRRYRDEFFEDYRPLSDLVSKIQGACFTLFAKHQEFARAYMANEIFKKLFANTFFKELALSNHWQHDLSLIMNDYDVKFEQVSDWHLALHQEGIKLKDQDFILIGLEIMGRRYHYDHQFENIKNAFREKGMVMSKSFTKQFKLNQKNYAKNEKEGHENYASNAKYQHMSAIHGYDYEKPLSEIKKKRQELRKEFEENVNNSDG